MKNLTLADPDFWNTHYINDQTNWDLGMVSPAIKIYIDQLTNKNLRILIPGCGNSYEAEYLAEKGFTDIILVDISDVLINRLKQKFINHPNIKLVARRFLYP